jgi:hypothetical protein
VAVAQLETLGDIKHVMNIEAGLFFFVVIIGLLPILRSGHWRWDVLAVYGRPILRIAFIHNLVVGMFWVGWFTSLIVGLLVLFRVVPFR